MMVDSDELYTGMDVDDDLSSVIGTKTLADRDLVPGLIILSCILPFPFGPSILLLYLQCLANARVVSSAGKLLIPERNALPDD
jgi:hypothetical protein